MSSTIYTRLTFIIYNNAYSEKRNIIKNNEGKAGIYRWTHLDTNKSYVGSSVNFEDLEVTLILLLLHTLHVKIWL